jgi:NADPH2:quinone reductase
MKCVVATHPGGPEVLASTETELPDLEQGEIRVAVEIAGVNYWDVMQRKGLVPLPPSHIPGVEGAGTIIDMAADVSDFTLGDRVAWSKIQGSYAELVQGPAQFFVPIPHSVPSEIAAAALMQGTTAWYLAHQCAPINVGDTVVVFAAAGGVGQLLTQLLVERGARVIAVVGSHAKTSIPLALGAAAVCIDSDQLVEEVRSIAPEGAHLVFDANGGLQALRDVRMLKTHGTVVYFGAAAGPLPAIDLEMLSAGSLAVRRVRGKDYIGDSASWRAAASEIMNRIEDGRLRIQLDSRVPLPDAARQHERIESRASTGKLLVDVAPVTL